MMKTKYFALKMTHLVMLCVIIAISSCKITQDVQKPVAFLPNNFRGSTVTDTTLNMLLSRNEVFVDQHLRNLIDTALIRNMDLQLAVSNIDAAEKMFKQSKLGYLPAINLAVNGSTSRPSDNSLNGLTLNQFLGTRHVEDYSAAAVLSWEADIWGKVRNQKADALAGFLQTSEARKAVHTKLVADVASGYYNLLMLDAQLNVAQANVLLNDSTLRIIRFQYDAGQVTVLAVEQAQAQLLAARELLPRFGQDILIQENAISLLLGKTPGPVSRSASLDASFPLIKINEGVPSQVLQMRPDVKMAELDIDRANAQVGINRSNFYPALRITAQGGINSFMASNWFNIPASLFGNILGGLTQPVFDRGRLRTQYELAKIEREKSVIRFRQQVLTAVGEVSDALVKIDKLSQQRSEADQKTEILRQSGSNANQLFASGMASYLEVITAQSNVLQSELRSVELKRDQLAASVELYRSIGGGLQ